MNCFTNYGVSENKTEYTITKSPNLKSHIVNENYLSDVAPGQRVISINTDHLSKLYKCPSTKSIDARIIWEQAGIPDYAYIENIEFLLLNWAYTYADLTIENDEIKIIKWKSSKNYTFKANWNTFIRWIICASLGN
jgi:hypothetical protein